MILAADIPGNLIFLIVFAAVGVVNWWLERKKNQAAASKTPPSRPQPNAAPSASGGDSEQERLRRFLEALGVPQQPGQPPRQPPSRPVRQPSPPPAPAPRAMRKEVELTRRTSIPEQRRIPAPPRPVPKRPTFVEPEEFQLAGRLEEPTRAIDSVSSEFEHMTMQQLGVSMHLAQAPSAPAVITKNAVAPVVESLHRALRTPSDLRTAFVTMELLGKPRGLQS